MAALLLAAVMAVGIHGLGELLGGATLLARWVRGWTALWWTMALVAVVAAPGPAAVVGAAVIVVAAAWSLWRSRRSWRGSWPWLVAFLAGAPLYLLPPTFYDALVYHLGLPWTWLASSSFAPVPQQVFSHFPVAVPTVSLIPVAVGLEEAAAGLHWASLVVLAAGAAGLARRLGGGRWAWAAPVLLVACWHVVWIASQAAVDLLVAAVFVAAVEAVVERAGRVRWWLDLGLAGGLAMAIKYPAFVPVAGLLVGALVAAPTVWRQLVAAGVVATVAACPVLLRNLMTTGNPVYPLLWDLLGGSGWSARDQARWQAIVHEGVSGVASLATGLVRLVRPPGGLGWWALAALPLMALAVLSRGEHRADRRLVGSIAGVCLLGWLVTSQTTRYAFPLASLMAILAASGLALLTPPARRVCAVAGGLAVAHGLVVLVAFVTGPAHVLDAWGGSEARERWRASVTVNDPLPSFRAAAEVLTEDDRLLVVGEGRSWRCPWPYHVSSPYDTQRLQLLIEGCTSAEEVAGRLREQGWTHLLINWAELERLGGPRFQVLRWQDPADARRWRELVRGHTERVLVVDGCELRRLVDR